MTPCYHKNQLNTIMEKAVFEAFANFAKRKKALLARKVANNVVLLFFVKNKMAC